MTQLKDGGRQPSNREERSLSASTVIARWQGNWDEPCKSRGLRTVLWAAGGEIPPADPAAWNPCRALSPITASRTDRQGQSGLGLEAQRAAVAGFVGARELVAEFTEVESGRRTDRPQLAAALELCRRQRAMLVIAKLDRLARNVAFIANLMEPGVEFTAVDMPYANKLTLHILAAVAEQRLWAGCQPMSEGGSSLAKSHRPHRTIYPMIKY